MNVRTYVQDDMSHKDDTNTSHRDYMSDTQVPAHA